MLDEILGDDSTSQAGKCIMNKQAQQALQNAEVFHLRHSCYYRTDKEKDKDYDSVKVVMVMKSWEWKRMLKEIPS